MVRPHRKVHQVSLTAGIFSGSSEEHLALGGIRQASPEGSSLITRRYVEPGHCVNKNVWGCGILLVFLDQERELFVRVTVV